MEGETEHSDDERAFNNAKVYKRIAIVSAGAIVNIVFGIISFFILIAIVRKDIQSAFNLTGEYLLEFLKSLKMLFTGQVGMQDMTGPIGISQIVSQSSNIKEFVYLLSMISLSLGITNLLPIPALDGGKIVLLLIEAIRKKPLRENVEIAISLIGFFILITISIFVTYNDIIRIFN